MNESIIDIYKTTDAEGVEWVHIKRKHLDEMLSSVVLSTRENALRDAREAVNALQPTKA